MPPQLLGNMVPGWKWQRGGGQGLIHNLNQLGPGEPSSVALLTRTQPGAAWAHRRN